MSRAHLVPELPRPRGARDARRRIVPGWIMPMTGRADAQTEAARVAAGTRQAIAKKIATLVPKVEDDAEALVVLHLAEAYVHLASEPPRARAV